MTEYLADPSDVRVEIDTELEDTDIDRILARVARDIGRTYDDDPDDLFDDDAHQQDFEAVLTALRIATGRDRRAETENIGSYRVTYETAVVDGLKAQLMKLDPGEAFTSTGGTRRNTDRHVRSTRRAGTENENPDH